MNFHKVCGRRIIAEFRYPALRPALRCEGNRFTIVHWITRTVDHLLYMIHHSNKYGEFMRGNSLLSHFSIFIVDAKSETATGIYLH